MQHHSVQNANSSRPAARKWRLPLWWVPAALLLATAVWHAQEQLAWCTHQISAHECRVRHLCHSVGQCPAPSTAGWATPS